MKLAQITALQEDVDHVTAAQAWFNDVYGPIDKPTVIGNPDGTIDVKGTFNDMGPEYPSHLPRIRLVTGTYTASKINHAMPQFVGREFEFHGAVAESDATTVKLSQFPRALPGSNAKFEVGNRDLLIVDDPTILDNYGSRSIGLRIIQGFQNLPIKHKYDYVSVKDDVSTFPTGLATKLLYLDISDPSTFRSIHKRLKVVEVDKLDIFFAKPTPIIGLILSKFKRLSIFTQVPNADGLAEIVQKLSTQYNAGELDALEIQGMLIDAGFAAWARL